MQNNEWARPIFKNVFTPIKSITTGAITIENMVSTDHETFDHYNIPAFEYIQDRMSYDINHHTNLDVLEYVYEDDVMKNAVILAWTIYTLDNMKQGVPRKGD